MASSSGPASRAQLSRRVRAGSSAQGTRRQDPLQPVQLRASVTNAQGNVVGSESALLGVRDFSTERAADHYLALPLATLATGEYLLRIETDMGTRHAGRVMRFSLK